VRWEAGRDPRVATRHAEISGEHIFDAPAGPFKLTGRADRIDIFKDGTVGIYDYKTGQPPTAKQVLPSSRSSPLEAAYGSPAASATPSPGARSPSSVDRPRPHRQDDLARPLRTTAGHPTPSTEAMARLTADRRL
jgi:RecB family exonuclease